ncbi:hypothetical protein HY947_00875 [Candidatus Gottesmanbacteria bacterium]|nr:hypothetical protein [Candidatus Gottesmanbacteria bacterium]
MKKFSINQNLLIAGSITTLLLISFSIGYIRYTSGSVLGVSTSSTKRESHVFLGLGSTASGDWADIPGAQAYIDSAKYGKILSVVFDATLRIPTGNEKVWVRLFNSTAKHPVWNSEMSTEGIGPAILSASKISLDAGNNLYQVQMKNQLNFPSFLDSSRIRITGE